MSTRPLVRRRWRVGHLRVEGDTCCRCEGRRRLVTAVTEPHAERRLLAALGLATEPSPVGTAPLVVVP